MDRSLSEVKADLRDRLRSAEKIVEELRTALRVLDTVPQISAPQENGSPITFEAAIARVLDAADRPLTYGEVVQRMKGLGTPLSGRPTPTKVSTAFIRRGEKRGWSKVKDVEGRVRIYKRASAADPGHLDEATRRTMYLFPQDTKKGG